MSSAAESSAADAAPPRRPRSALGVLLRDPMGAAGLAIVLVFAAMALFAPWIAPHDPLRIDVANRHAPPSWEHWAGTDQLGRDLLSRIVWGARIALGIAVAAVGIAGALGLLLGLLAGFGPRWLDALLLLLFDSLSSLPMILFALAVITLVGPGIPTLIGVIAVISVPGYARLVRAQTLALRNADFVLAERAMGASAGRILLVHLLPNVVGPLVILLSMDIPVVIMLEAGLSYLNFGVRPPTPSWGNILHDGYTSLREQPGMVLIAGLPLALCTLGFTFLGEALRDAIDPRLRAGPRP